MSAYTAGSGRKLEADVRRLAKRVIELSDVVATLTNAVHMMQQTFVRMGIEDADLARAQLESTKPEPSDAVNWRQVCATCQHPRERHYPLAGCEDTNCPCGGFTP